MKALVTGGRGFLGGYVVDELLRLGADVTVVSQQGQTADRAGLRWLRGDIRDERFAEEAARHVEIVFHLAGNIRTPDSDTKELHRTVNLGGTSNVLGAAARARTNRLVYVSTSEVYGDAAGEEIAEDSPEHPANAYAESKWLAEQECARRAGDLRITIVRPSYVFGFGQLPERVFPRLVAVACGVGAADGAPAPTPGSGGYDYVYVRDVAAGLVHLGLRHQSAPIDVFNMGSGRYTPILEVFETVRDLTGYQFGERPLPARHSESRFSLSMAKAAAAGFVGRFSLREGLEDFIARFRAAKALDRGR
jgi:nucleoside-diphosphate-sugar epimerase